MADLPLTWLDVFTDRRLTGNQLAVVHEADGLDDATMLAFARETRLSETAFVQHATVDGATYRNRIWMMRGELRFAGHPSLGTAVAVALARGQGDARYVQQTQAGLQPVHVRLGDDGVASAWVLQEPASFGEEVDPAQVAAAVGLDVADLHDDDLTPQVVSTGEAHVIAPVRAGALARVMPDAARLGALHDAAGTTVVYLAACDPHAGTARARSFFVGLEGASEDPGTGSAAGPLLAYLRERAGTQQLTVEQGIEMGRPSRIECRVDGERVRVGGDAVVVATGTVRL